MRHDQQVAEPAGILDEIRDLPVVLVGRAANRSHAIDDMSMTRRSSVKLPSGTKPCIGRTASSTLLPGAPASNLCFAAGFQASGKSANIHGQFESHRGNPGFYP